MMDVYEKYRLPSPLDGVSSAEDWAKRREEIKKLLPLEYGCVLKAPDKVTYEETDLDDRGFASKCYIKTVQFHIELDGKQAQFPVKFTVPYKEGKIKPIILLNFSPDIPSKYFPAEELIDKGFAVALIYYNDVTTDDGDFTTGIAPLFIEGERKPYDAGKIMMWAWAAMRVADYLQTTDWADMDFLAVAGHSRLGKTALLTGALDERFRFIHSNNAGCSGDTLFRASILDNRTETIRKITNVFPYWFAPAFRDYADREEELPFDQHYLFSLIAPRHLNVASARLDQWACPEGEFACCQAASPVYELLGEKGFITDCEALPEGEARFAGGNLTFHIRNGSHFFSRTDWNLFTELIR